jgi:hypothetical protein
MHALLDVLEAGLSNIHTAVPARNNCGDANRVVRAESRKKG